MNQVKSVTVKIQKQTKCPLVDEWVRKYGIPFSFQKKEILLLWQLEPKMIPEVIVLSDISLEQKAR